jgi:hypothetical protein
MGRIGEVGLEAVENMTGDDDPARTIDHIQTIRRAFEADVARINGRPGGAADRRKAPVGREPAPAGYDRGHTQWYEILPL